MSLKGEESDNDIVLLKTVRASEFPDTYIVKQTKRRRKKSPADLRCDDGDFFLEFGTDSRGSEFIICGRVEDSVCPTIGGEGGKVQSLEVEGDEKEELSAFVKCGYSSKAVISDTAITDYRNTFGSDEDFALVLSANCFQTSEECPIDPLTGRRMPLCSKFVSTTDTGRVCREEATLSANAETVEADMEAYCRTNTTADCRCINRTGTLIYDSLRTGTVTDDGCWWKSCSEPDKFLVPPNIVSATSEDVCVSVRKQISREINANLETIECCQIQQNVIYSPDGIKEEKVNCFFRDAQIAQSTWFSQYGWWVVLTLILIVFVIAGLFVIMVHHRQRYIGGYSPLLDYYQS